MIATQVGRDVRPSDLVPAANISRPSIQTAALMFGEDYVSTRPMSAHDFKVLRALAACRTEAMGGHLYRCNGCSYDYVVYNSCRSRYCPVCTAEKNSNWLQERTAELLPIDYRQVVFKLPVLLRALGLVNKRAVY